MKEHPVSYPLPQSGELEATDEVCDPCGAPKVIVHTKKGPWKICIDPDCPNRADKAKGKAGKRPAKKTAATTAKKPAKKASAKAAKKPSATAAKKPAKKATTKATTKATKKLSSDE
ncbi:MAG: DNA topoisomerase, partial [Actinomycetota bacterium]|nr:DNA topoisomerase [Actinomycetota bacterium]